MQTADDDNFIEPESIFAACADSTRLRILNLLIDGRELCVCDIIAVLGQPQAKISRHLGVLRAAGLVKQRVEANWRHYRLAKAGSSFHQKLIKCLSVCAESSPQLSADLDCLDRGACCAPIDETPIEITFVPRGAPTQKGNR